MNINKITREDFEIYEEVRSEGMYNMFDPNARALTGLDRDIYLGIIEHYNKLCEKYPGVRE